MIESEFFQLSINFTIFENYKRTEWSVDFHYNGFNDWAELGSGFLSDQCGLGGSIKGGKKVEILPRPTIPFLIWRELTWRIDSNFLHPTQSEEKGEKAPLLLLELLEEEFQFLLLFTTSAPVPGLAEVPAPSPHFLLFQARTQDPPQSIRVTLVTHKDDTPWIPAYFSNGMRGFQFQVSNILEKVITHLFKRGEDNSALNTWVTSPL